MSKLTPKLEEVLRIMGIAFDPHRPQIYYYGIAADRGLSWNGQCWVNGDTLGIKDYASVRIISSPNDHRILLTWLVDNLSKAGLNFHVSETHPGDIDAQLITHVRINSRL